MRQVLEMVNQSKHLRLDEALKTYIGFDVLTRHTREVRVYRVIGITTESVQKLNVHKRSMLDFFKERHCVTLERPDLPAFRCDDGAVLPVELCYIEDGR